MRMRYAQRIKQHVDDSPRMDKFVFVFSKVDKTDCLMNVEKVDMPQLYNTICNQYPDIFAPFENKAPLRWFKKYNCSFVPFSSGYYHSVVDYVPGPDVFPKLLWEGILGTIR